MQRSQLGRLELPSPHTAGSSGPLRSEKDGPPSLINAANAVENPGENEQRGKIAGK